MKILTHPVMLALGAATLYLLGLIAPLVSPSHTAIYHLSGSALPIFVAVLIDLCVMWFALTLLLWLGRKPGWLQTVAWTCLIVLLPRMIMKDWFSLTTGAIPHWMRFLGLLTPLIICVAAFLALQPAFAPLFQKIQGFSKVVLGFASLSALFILCQLLWFAWEARDLNSPLPLHQQKSSAVAADSKPKIIWIILDELSYQQVYEQRFPGLHLPSFDQLADESTMFTHVVPVGTATEAIIPSLMTGLPVDQIQASANGRRLLVHNAQNSSWGLFEPQQTIFQDALNAGYSTGVAGWFNPYCRVLSQVLDNCFWTSHPDLIGGMYSSQSALWNAVRYPIGSFNIVLSSLGLTAETSNSLHNTQFHQLDYRGLFDAADKLLIDPSTNFIFLHLPVPHPGGIYDRNKSTFTTYRTSYIDNLALADKYLAHLRLVLEQHGDWDSSAVVLMGDHSWRTQIVWAKLDGWTREDQAASHGGQFDDRPGYIVKLPNQQKPARIEDRFEAVRTRALLEGIMANRIRTPEDLADWVRRQN